MDKNEFLNALERSNLVAPKTIVKLRERVDKTAKKVTAESIAKFLIEKEVITRFQAKQLLTSQPKPAEDFEIEVDVEASQDTGELLLDLVEEAPEAPEVVPTILEPELGQTIEDVDATRMMDPMNFGTPEISYDANALDPHELDAPFGDPNLPGELVAEEFGALGAPTAIVEGHEDEADAAGFSGKKGCCRSMGLVTLGIYRQRFAGSDHRCWCDSLADIVRCRFQPNLGGRRKRI